MPDRFNKSYTRKVIDVLGGTIFAGRRQIIIDRAGILPLKTAKYLYSDNKGQLL